MACINADGTISESARILLKLATEGPLTAEDIAGRTGRALFLVRSSLRELTAAGFVREQDARYATTELGKKKLMLP